MNRALGKVIVGGIFVMALTLPALIVSAQNAPENNNKNKELSALDAKVLEWAKECGKRLSTVMEKWISSGKISKDKLFSYLYYPIPGTDPPKFHTDYDKLADKEIFSIQEEYVRKNTTSYGREGAIVFVVLVDKNGYLPTHNKRYSQRPTHNKAADLLNNRTKRIFNDRTGITAARNKKPYLLQKYMRDTGEIMADLSVPVYIKGSHWGALRIGYKTATVKKLNVAP